MATNEQRAKLVGSRSFYQEREGYGEVVDTGPSPYDTSRDACAELLEHVRKQGVRCQSLFMRELKSVVADAASVAAGLWEFDLLVATPAQICAAFDATFKDEI